MSTNPHRNLEGADRSHLRLHIWSLLLVIVAALTLAAPVQAQGTAKQDTVPPNIEAFLSLLGDPGVQDWLRAHKVTATQDTSASAATSNNSPRSHLFADYVAAVREHIYRLARSVPTLPDQFSRAASLLADDIEESGIGGLVALFGLFAVLSLAARSYYRRATLSFVDQNGRPPPASRREELAFLTRGLVHQLGEVAVIGATGTAVFLLLDFWPDVVERILIAYLLALVFWLVARAVARLLLASVPGKASAFRIVPLDDAAARFWVGRIDLLSGILAFGYASVLSMCLLGFSDEACEIAAYGLGLAILVVGESTLWRGLGAPQIGGGVADAAALRNRRWAVFLSVVSLALWGLWVLGAVPLFQIGAIVTGLVCAIKVAQICVDHLFNCPDDSLAVVDNSGTTAALCGRAIRFGLILVALLLVARALQVDFSQFNSMDSRTSRIIHGLLTAGMLLLAADLIWSVLRTLIDQQISKLRTDNLDPSEAARRPHRFGTLLPILRNFLFVIIAAVAVLMALSEMGVEIGPLIAGAGVAGVALGFGAQTLVKDIISGIFYLIDDAFRVGEYIESGSYKGTVESFSLRSVRLRHTRGPIFTVPFGSLGAVQNMSRDWQIEKMKLTITYDSDVEKARKLIKKIGLELAEDPQFKAITIEPLKMQGVDNFGDYGLDLKLKFKTMPGQQFAVRRRALFLIKKAFDENGIKLSSPSVQVMSSTPAHADQAITTAAAHHSVAIDKPLSAS